jgi:very-short-patch-repair endonuclease
MLAPMDPAATTLTRVSDLASRGATRAEIARTVQGLERLSRGRYASTAELTPRQRHLLAVSAVVDRVQDTVGSHVSAATAWGLPTRPGDLTDVHLAPTHLRRGKPKFGPGYCLHSLVVEAGDVDAIDGLPVTAPLRTVLDCARSLDSDWGFVIAEAALRADLVTAAALRARAARIRRLHGAARARALAEGLSELSESPGETLLRRRLLRMGLTVEEQVVLEHVPGRPRVDFLVHGRVVVEFDGRAKYSLAGDVERAHWEEKQRHDSITEQGHPVVRVIWAQLWDEPALADRMHRALRRGGVPHG